jgi:hypothetical protein
VPAAPPVPALPVALAVLVPEEPPPPAAPLELELEPELELEVLPELTSPPLRPAGPEEQDTDSVKSAAAERSPPLRLSIGRE